MYEINCRCGAVGLRLEGEPVAQLFCHCDDCQAAHRAAYVMAAVYPAAKVHVLRGELTPLVIRTTPRMRCAACGDPVFSEIQRVGMRSVNGYLLPAGAFKPQFHVQCAHAVLPVVDKLPHFKGYPAAMGGADEFVAW